MLENLRISEYDENRDNLSSADNQQETVELSPGIVKRDPQRLYANLRDNG